MAGFHHVEVWLADLGRVNASWGWLLNGLGFVRDSEWPGGETWSAGGAYLVLTTSPNLSSTSHDRRQPGVNHLAFDAGERSRVDELMQEASSNGWVALYHDRYPQAGGSEHYAGWLENSDGFKVELVATT